MNAVAPTFTYTPGTAERLDQPEFRASVLSRIPRGELGTIDDVASAVHYLASDHANMASVSILVIDGGWTTVSAAAPDQISYRSTASEAS